MEREIATAGVDAVGGHPARLSGCQSNVTFSVTVSLICTMKNPPTASTRLVNVVWKAAL